ncbi:MAG TPA: Hsp20/alpha crystallin family protein [Thermomicrobiales bacterium]
MRFRRMSYRYTVIMNASQPFTLTDIFRAQPGVHLAQTCWRPATDVYESAETVTITIELAGIDPEDVDVSLFADAVVIEGHRRLQPPDTAGVYHAAEIRQGPFRLELPLPVAIDADRAEARYDRGLLLVTLPKLNSR